MQLRYILYIIFAVFAVHSYSQTPGNINITNNQQSSEPLIYEGWGCVQCDSTQSTVSLDTIIVGVLDTTIKTTAQPCLDISVLANATIQTICQAQEMAGITASVTGGSGNNNIGNRYTVSFPDLGLGANYKVKLTALSNVNPNGLIVGNVVKTPTSVSFQFYSGDDGAGVDDSRRTDFDLEITGCTCDLLADIQFAPASGGGGTGTNGINCWDTNSNGVNDAFEDVNNDGQYNALDCQGADGQDGINGIDGQDGAQGAQGIQGIQGPAGQDGTNGINGQDGADGSDGLDGYNCWDLNNNRINDASEDVNNDGVFNTLDCQSGAGANGSDGINCWDINGNSINEPSEDVNNDGQFNALDCQGEDGQDGTDGINGTNGTNGINGINGTNGVDGQDGADGINCWDLNNNGVNDPSEDTNNDGFFNASDCQSGAGANGADGINCWDTNGNGNNDAFEDTNNDGQFNALDCQGAQGIQGPQGIQGQQGVQGNTGATGATGAQGPQGVPGPAGADGQDGADGIDGQDGAQGPPGPTGPQGPQGVQGPQGATGPQGPAGQDADPFECNDLNSCDVQDLGNVTGGTNGTVATWQNGNLVPTIISPSNNQDECQYLQNIGTGFQLSNLANNCPNSIISYSQILTGVSNDPDWCEKVNNCVTSTPLTLTDSSDDCFMNSGSPHTVLNNNIGIGSGLHVDTDGSIDLGGGLDDVVFICQNGFPFSIFSEPSDGFGTLMELVPAIDGSSRVRTRAFASDGRNSEIWQTPTQVYMNLRDENNNDARFEIKECQTTGEPALFLETGDVDDGVDVTGKFLQAQDANGKAEWVDLPTQTITSVETARVLINSSNANTTFSSASFGAIEKDNIGISVSGSNLVLPAGEYRFEVIPNFDSNVERSNINCRFLYNGSQFQKVFGKNYTRNASNHNNTSDNYVAEHESAGGTYRFIFEAEAATGTVPIVNTANQKSVVLIHKYTEYNVTLAPN